MSEIASWNDRYQAGETPWDTGRPSSELQRVVKDRKIRPCRAVELGCGTGTNCVWLAQQGFDVTGMDVAPLAIRKAEERARSEGVSARFLAADVLQPPDLGQPFAFFFDRGCYHAIRREHPHTYVQVLSKLLAPGALGLVLTGNAREPHVPGPPVVSEEQIRDELGREFKILDLHEFRFDSPPEWNESFLAWSCLLEK